MSSIIRQSIVILFLGVFALTETGALAREEPASDRTLSPYFFIDSDDPAVDRLPLKSTSAEVSISGVIADVTVTQVYKNEGKTPLEALYVFPASTRAAVYGMTMTIGERVIHAKISRREEARKEYEQARQEGKSASLLEQHRPNVFQMNVANIMPGDVVRTELRYTELLVPADRTYEFIYPTVVGPRYSNETEEEAPPSERWMQNPYLHEGESPHYTFDIAVTLNAGLPVHGVRSSSHKIHTTYEGPSTARIGLDASEAYGGNRDFILNYRLDGDRIESGLLLYEGEEENYFLLMLQPPTRVRSADIPGREYIFIVDVSGSMHGFPLEISKKLLKDLIGGLRPTDRFNVLLFAGGSSVLSPYSLAATQGNIQHAIRVIDNQHGGGGTELLPALQKALTLPRTEGVSRSIVIATDGYVTVEEEAFDLIRSHLDQANLFAFGIGTSVNRHIIEGMAHVGMGEPFIITRPEEAPSQADAFRTLIQSPLLTGITVDFGTFDAYDIEPVSIPDVLAERPVIVFGKWQGRPRGRIRVSGTSGNGPWEQSLDAGKVRPREENAALRYLWARHRIRLLSDYTMLRADDRRIEEVTGLGLRYNLLTAYTSFIAVDSMVRNEGGSMASVKQPLPLAEGVSDYAVGGVAAQSPAPWSPLKTPGRVLPGAREYKVAEEPAVKAENDEPALTIGRIHVKGPRSKEEVLREIHQRLNAIGTCSGQGVFSGVIVQFDITAEGRVTGVKVIPGRSGYRTGEACIIRHIEKWQFQATEKKEATTVTLTFTT